MNQRFKRSTLVENISVGCRGTASNRHSSKAPLRGSLMIGAATDAGLAERLRPVRQSAETGHAPDPAAPAASELQAPERLAIDYGNAFELADRSAKALKALDRSEERRVG